jgi:transposase
VKYDRAIYRALLDSGMSRREIARHLGVNESSVRRALKGYVMRADPQRFEITVRPL